MTMKTIFNISLGIFILLFISPNLAGNDITFCYWVAFKDKKNNGYVVYNPETYLSRKSLERKKRYQIEIDFMDIPVTKAYTDSITNLGFNIQGVSKWFNGAIVNTTDSLLAYQLNSISAIKEFKLIGKFDSYLKSAKNKFDIEQYSNDSFQESFTQVNLQNGFFLHNRGYRGNGMTIAIIDAGFKQANTLAAFDSIRNRNGIKATRDFTTYPTYFYDTYYHGMSVFSIISGNIPNQLIGTAPDADVVLLRSEVAVYEQPVEEYNWVMAAEFADSLGVDILSTSLGYSTYNFPFKSYSQDDMDGKTSIIAQASTIAARKGILVVCSTGNAGNNPWKTITTPGDADSILSVGALDYLGNAADFSSYGPSADGRIKPDVAAMGDLVTVQYPDGQLVTGSGTSFACPIISGLAACLWQAFPQYNCQTIRKTIIQSSSLLNYPDDQMGYGIPDFEIAYNILDLYENSQSITKVYPNVFTGSINLDIISETPQSLLIEIYNVHGHKLHVENKELNLIINNIRLDLSFLPKGLYLLSLNMTDHKDLHKIIKTY